MIENIILFIIGTGLIYTLGISIFVLFFDRKKNNDLGIIPVFFGLGTISIIFFSFITSLFGIKISIDNYIFIIFFISILSLKYKRVAFLKYFKKFIFKLNRSSIIFIILFVILCMFSVRKQVSGWDGIANWFMLAKAIFINAGINPDIYKILNFENPPGFPLLINFYYMIFGGIDDRTVLLIYPLFYLNSIILFYFFIKKVFLFKYAVVITFIFALTPKILDQISFYEIGYVDFVLSFYFILCFYIFSSFKESKNESSLFMTHLFLGFLPFIKNEGAAFYFVFNIILFIYLRKSFLNRIIILSVFTVSSWILYKYINNLPINLMMNGYIHLERIPIIIKYFIFELFNIKKWGFILALILLIFNKSFIKTNIILFSLILSMNFVYIFIYLFIPIEVEGNIISTIDRFFLQVFPLTYIFIVINYNKEIKNSLDIVFAFKNIWIKKIL